jgi:hypothetical protein
LITAICATEGVLACDEQGVQSAACARGGEIPIDTYVAVSLSTPMCAGRTHSAGT